MEDRPIDDIEEIEEIDETEDTGYEELVSEVPIQNRDPEVVLQQIFVLVKKLADLGPHPDPKFRLLNACKAVQMKVNDEMKNVKG